jgi:hypothetical protein
MMIDNSMPRKQGMFARLLEDNKEGEKLGGMLSWVVKKRSSQHHNPPDWYSKF